ncbi:3D domain-containing protein [Dethiobacter alkaliphilus]|uniref:3D domain-containing protein n=1 Tax=Dethiobacter alkaliphilus TaxID=427926 RepID=UPI0022266650|nr:3D domain-containing protein [Dethiobacter alkaliphilus]MCW3489100.1 3D domain-containing protein [Dethiobacter alkaliphilus]
MEQVSLRARTGAELPLSARYAPVVFLFVSAVLVLLAINIASHDVELVVDGESKAISTFSHNVAELLEETGVVVGEADFLSPGLEQNLQQGMVIELRRAFTVTVLADGAEYKHQVADATVAQVLAALEIELMEMDRVEPAGDHLLVPGDSVRVVRVERKLVAEQTELPYREVRRSNPELDRGEIRVLAQGQAGLREDTVEIVSEDGEEVSVKIVQSEMVQPREDRVVEYGDNTVLARGGRSVSFDRVFQMEATAYCSGTAATGCPIDANGRSQCTGSNNNGITASGQKAVAGTGSENNPHLVAVDTNLIPLGSRLYIDGYGYAVAADTGGVIVGNKIDLLFGTHQEALQFGRRNLRVYLLP